MGVEPENNTRTMLQGYTFTNTGGFSISVTFHNTHDLSLASRCGIHESDILHFNEMFSASQRSHILAFLQIKHPKAQIKVFRTKRLFFNRLPTVLQQ